MKYTRHKLGIIGESLAIEFLKRKKYTILARRFRKRGGEVDIIAAEGDELVFIEVKTRTNRAFGLPEDAIDQYKLRKIEIAAEYFIIEHPEFGDRARIDCIFVEIENGRKARLRHISNVRPAERLP